MDGVMTMIYQILEWCMAGCKSGETTGFQTFRQVSSTITLLLDL